MAGEVRTPVQVYCDVLPEQLGALERIASTADANGALSVYAWPLLCETALRMARTVGFDNLAALLEELDSRAHAYSMAPAQADEGARHRVSELIAHIRVHGGNIRPEHSSLWRSPDAESVAPSAHSQLKNAMILFVDEDPIARQIAETRLKATGARDVILANDGRDGLAQSDPEQPFAIIADWRTGPMGGLELLMEVRKGRTHVRADTPFVLVKRAHERKALRAGIRAGADYFLIKPFTEAALIHAIEAAAQRHAHAPMMIAAPMQPQSSWLLARAEV